MEIVSVLCLLLLLCSLSGAEHSGNEIIEQRKASPESVNVEEPQPCPPDLHAVLRDMCAKLAENRLMIQQLQTLNQEQAAKLKELEKQTSHVDILKLQQQEHAAKLREVDTLKLQQQEQAAKLRELQTSEVDPIKEQLRGQVAELNSLKTWSNVTESHVDSLRKDRAVRQVAFSASLLTSGSGYTGPFNAHTPLVFRNVISNIGNAYNPNTGYFIAPVRGAYHFEFYIAGYGNSQASGAGLLKNGEHIVIAYEHEARYWGQSANAATLLLEVNDVVSLRLWANTRIHENHNRHNTFSGHLLFRV